MGGFDVLVRGGLVVGAAGVARGDIAIADGLVAEIGLDLVGGAGVEIDATGCHVFPGVVDPHVHLNDPGDLEWEGFPTGTAAFAAGGGTCLFDMPLNASPPTVDGPSFDLKLEAARGRALVDFCLWGGLVPGDVDRLDELAERGVVGFKAFMCDSGRDDFAAADDLTLFEGMQRAARLGLPVAVHAENDTITRRLADRARAEGRRSMRDYVDSRPAVAEREAVGRAILLAEETGCSLHVVHVSTGAAIALVSEARARGVAVTCETSPHYLVLTDDDAERIGALAKCSPPLRPRSEVEELWSALLAGSVPIIASDHSPSSPELKDDDDVFASWGGIAGCQTTRGAILAESETRGLALTAVASLTATMAAVRFSLASKGRLEVGYDADLALVDLSFVEHVVCDDLLYRHPMSAFVGTATRGRVTRTVLRGRTVMQDGEVVAAPTTGRLVRPR